MTGQQHTLIVIEREDDSGTEPVRWEDRNNYFTNFCMTQLSHTLEEPETGYVEYWHILKQSKGSAVRKDWILLDSHYTVDVFYNTRLLRNIRKVNRTLDIHCNAGVASTDMVGGLPGYGTVWYHQRGISNILSLSHAIKIFTITYVSANGNEFCMHKENGEDRLLRQSENGLYFWNAHTFNQEEVVLIITVFPVRHPVSGPKICSAAFTSSTISGQLLRHFLFTIVW